MFQFQLHIFIVMHVSVAYLYRDACFSCLSFLASYGVQKIIANNSDRWKIITILHDGLDMCIRVKASWRRGIT
jgi:hypothetical protein